MRIYILKHTSQPLWTLQCTLPRGIIRSIRYARGSEPDTGRASNNRFGMFTHAAQGLRSHSGPSTKDANPPETHNWEQLYPWELPHWPSQSIPNLNMSTFKYGLISFTTASPPLGPIAEGLAARSLGGCAHSFDPRAQEKRRWNRAYNLNLPGIRCLSMYMALQYLMEYQFIHKRWVWQWNK